MAMKKTQRPDTVFVCNCVSGRCKCHLVFFPPKNVAVRVGQDATAMTDFFLFFFFVFKFNGYCYCLLLLLI